MTSPATVLREIADLLDDGMPAPINVTLGGKTYRPNILVRVQDIGYWLSRLDLPEPEWHGDEGCPLHARWPAGAFGGIPYDLACVSMAGCEVAS